MKDAEVFAVYWARPDDTGAIAAIYTTSSEAESVAWQRSTDDGVVYAAVVGFQLDRPGTRRAVACFVRGERQKHQPWAPRALRGLALDDEEPGPPRSKACGPAAGARSAGVLTG